MEHGGPIRLRKSNGGQLPADGNERSVIFQADIRLPIRGGAERRNDSRRLPLRHPKLVIRGGPGALLRPKRRRLDSGWLHTPTGSRLRVQPLCRADDQRLLLWRHLLRHVTGQASILGPRLWQHHAVHDWAFASHLYQHVMVESVPGKCVRTRQLPALGGKLPGRPQ